MTQLHLGPWHKSWQSFQWFQVKLRLVPHSRSHTRQHRASRSSQVSMLVSQTATKTCEWPCQQIPRSWPTPTVGLVTNHGATPLRESADWLNWLTSLKVSHYRADSRFDRQLQNMLMLASVSPVNALSCGEAPSESVVREFNWNKASFHRPAAIQLSLHVSQITKQRCSGPLHTLCTAWRLLLPLPLLLLWGLTAAGIHSIALLPPSVFILPLSIIF